MVANKREKEIKAPKRSWRIQNKPINSLVVYRDMLYSSSTHVEMSNIERLLEAEKRRLLGEIEPWTIFMKKDEVTIFMKKDEVDTLAMASDFHMIEKNGNGSKEQHHKIERVSIKDNAFVGRSVKIDG